MWQCEFVTAQKGFAGYAHRLPHIRFVAFLRALVSDELLRQQPAAMG